MDTSIIAGLITLVVVGYGIAFMVGGPKLANRFARWIGWTAWRSVRWTTGAVLRFSGWTLRQFEMAGGKLLGRVGRRIAP